MNLKKKFTLVILCWLKNWLLWKMLVITWATSWENLLLFMPYANNKGADQPAHPHSLISTFAVCFLDSIIPLLNISEISRLASLCSWAGRFESYLVGNCEDRFSHDMAYLTGHLATTERSWIFSPESLSFLTVFDVLLSTRTFTAILSPW